MRASEISAQLIVDCEVTSATYYDRNYQRPTWPGAASGVTIGIGHDMGYATAAEIAESWGDLVAPAMLAAMQHVAGVTGDRAKLACQSVRGLICIPYSAAIKVFIERDIPKYEAGMIRAMPRSVELSPDSFGALLSISYNRGSGAWTMTDDRHREMLAIRAAVSLGDFTPIAGLIRQMKRLWIGQPGMAGLLTRRDAEADLFERGLGRAASVVAAAAPVGVAAPAKAPVRAELTADDLNAAQIASWGRS